MDSKFLSTIDEFEESLKHTQDLIGEREISENLRYKIKELKRSSHSTIIQLQNELLAETQKSSRLENAFKVNCKYVDYNAELQIKLKEAENKEKEMQARLLQLDDYTQNDSLVSGKLSFCGQYLQFSKRIKELESEVAALKKSQQKVITERNMTVLSLQSKLEDAEMYINTLTKELSECTGEALVDSMNDLVRTVDRLEKENQFLRKDLEYYNALDLKSPSDLNSESDFKKKNKQLEQELRTKECDIDQLEKRLDDNRKLRNELVEYTVSLEAKIKSLEEENSKLQDEISSKEENIKTLDIQLLSYEQKSREEEEFIFKQLNRKAQVLTVQIKEQAVKNLAQIQDLNTEIADLTHQNTQLNKDINEIKETNIKISSDLSNSLELQDQISYKFQKTIDELTHRIQILTNEKVELEHKLELSNIVDTRSSFADAKSFEDELCRLREYRASWINVRKSIPEEITVKYEGIIEESAKKDSLILTLQLQNQDLKKDVEKYKELYNDLQNEYLAKAGQVEELLNSLETSRQEVKTLELELQRIKFSSIDCKVIRFQLENETLHAELEKLQTDLILSKNHFAEEINNLSEELLQNEKFTRGARSEISKLTEERNIYRAYIEKLRSKSKKVKKGSSPNVAVLFR